MNNIKLISTIIKEDRDKLSVYSIRTLKLIDREYKTRTTQASKIHAKNLMLHFLLKEIDDYLSDNPKNYMGSGSVLHEKIKDALK